MQIIVSQPVDGGEVATADLISAFGRRLSRGCIAALDIAGVTPSGVIVLRSPATGPCASPTLWELPLATQSSSPAGGTIVPRAVPLTRTAAVLPLNSAPVMK